MKIPTHIRPHVSTILILKGVVFIGIGASYFLPPQHAVAASLLANALWLFKL